MQFTDSQPSLVAQLVKNPPAMLEKLHCWEDPLGKEGKGYPLRYSGLKNSMDCIVHWVTKSRIRLSDHHITTGLGWGVGVCVWWGGVGEEKM